VYAPLAGMQVANRDLGGAEASLQKALQLNPANLDALILLAMEELRGRTHQAEDVYRRALQLDPNYAQRQTILPI